MTARIALLLLSLALFPATAHAQLRDLCPERPGLDTPPCIVDKGHFQIEMGLVDVTRDQTAERRSTTITLGDAELRYGLDNRTEIRASWASYSWRRDLDRLGGGRNHISGIGDLSLGLKHALLNPAGDALSLAIAPAITLPTGSHAVSDGSWSASFQLPFSYALSESLSLIATPEIDAAADGNGHGRHLAYGSAGGLSADLGEKWNASLEMQIIRDRDPDDPSTQALSSVSLAFKPAGTVMLDAGANLGLNRATPDAEVYIGISRRF
ncbi:transporter [Sphingobium sp.]|uniref:transporter n=1 Tax=Sphingobium sp. TaxID=1912891 RepID=UPI0028BEA2B0|nr:transporter [Sphingobium sp.]